MNKKKVFRNILLIFGCALLLGAFVFFVISAVKNGRMKINTEESASFLESVIPERTAGIKEERRNSEMPAVSYDGQDYSAILSLPRFSVNLPVRASWDKSAVSKVPCRFTGNPYEGTLVIGGVDAEGQFDFVPKIDIGDEVAVTDMKGNVFTYTVSTVKHAKNAKAKTLIDENFDLTLFAKDKKTGDWLLVRCNMK